MNFYQKGRHRFFIEKGQCHLADNKLLLHVVRMAFFRGFCLFLSNCLIPALRWILLGRQILIRCGVELNQMDSFIRWGANMERWLILNILYHFVMVHFLHQLMVKWIAIMGEPKSISSKAFWRRTKDVSSRFVDQNFLSFNFKDNLICADYCK